MYLIFLEHSCDNSFCYLSIIILLLQQHREINIFRRNVQINILKTSVSHGTNYGTIIDVEIIEKSSIGNKKRHLSTRMEIFPGKSCGTNFEI